jgi:hypothetical protein
VPVSGSCHRCKFLTKVREERFEFKKIASLYEAAGEKIRTTNCKKSNPWY